MHIPAFLRYDLEGNLREDLPEAKGQLQIAGLRGTGGFATGFRRAGARQKKLLQIFLSALARDDVPAMLGALSSTVAVTLGDSDALGLAELRCTTRRDHRHRDERRRKHGRLSARTCTGDHNYCCAGDKCRTNSVMERSKR
jgi:hypothetical protein